MSVPAQKILVTLAACMMMTACASIGPPLPPSLDLPKPPTDLRAVRKGDRVILTWTIPTLTTDRSAARNIGATRVCRGLQPELSQCGTPVGEVQAVPTAPASSKQKAAASFTDALPLNLGSDDASSFATYAIEVRNAEGRSAGLSNQVRIALARTLPPPPNFAAHMTAQGVSLSWTNSPPPSPLRHLYRIRRRLEGGPDETLVGEVPATPDTAAALTDSSFEWQKTYEYTAETVTLIPQKDKPDLQIEGDDSAPVKVFANDVFPPAIPSGLQAVFSGPGQQPFIDLIWSPVSDADLDGYNIYRQEDGAPAVKVNADLLKSPAYRDTNVTAGKHYSYAVTAVDLRGNESARSEAGEESVP